MCEKIFPVIVSKQKGTCTLFHFLSSEEIDDIIFHTGEAVRER